MADNRNARELDTRETAQRTQDWAPPALLPTPAAQPGWVYRWIRTSMVGQTDPTNFSSKRREGWEPVKATDHPELMYMADAPTGRFKDNVEQGGLLLCRAPEETMKQRERYYLRQAQAQLEAVDNNYLRMNDPRMPMDKLGPAIQRDTKVSFGRGNT